MMLLLLFKSREQRITNSLLDLWEINALKETSDAMETSPDLELLFFPFAKMTKQVFLLPF